MAAKRAPRRPELGGDTLRANAKKAAAKKPAVSRRRIGPVEKATRHDLAALRKLDPALADGGAAAAAVAMAREIDDGENSATSKSMCTAKLIGILADLRALAPPERKVDSIDRIAAQREKRQAAAAAGGAATANLSRT